MSQGMIKRAIAVILVIAMLPLGIGYNQASAEETEVSTGTYTVDTAGDMFTQNYTNISKTYTAPEYKGESIVFEVDEKEMKLGEEFSLKVEVPETAQYFVKFNYKSSDTSSILPLKLAFMVDGDYPFYECRYLKWESTWVAPAEISVDRYGDQIISIPDKLMQWESKYLMDSSYRHSGNLKLELTKGTHTFLLTVKEGSVVIGDISLEPVSYIEEYTSSEAAPGDGFVQIQAEEFTYRNDSSIRAVAEFDTSLDPYKVTDTLLNTIDSASYNTAGQTITYEFKVDKPGYYYIANNYRQGDKNDFPVFVDIAIDGNIPNTAFEAYAFDYTTRYTTDTLTDASGNKLSVYLEAGTHTISYTISNDPIKHVLEKVDLIMTGINDLSLEITKVAGTKSSRFRDLDLVKYIPNLQETMYGWTEDLDKLYESIVQYNPDVKEIGAFSSLNLASELIKDLAEDPSEIPYRVNELCISKSSINQHLANLVDTLNRNNLSLDRIYIYQEDAELPGKIGFFKSVSLNIQRFFSSFFEQAYSTKNTDESHLQVWVARSRLHLEVMQKMIDEQFTPATGIVVDLSIMPDQNKLILANSSGDSPDIATGINYAQPYELAIRGALKDLTEFADYQEIMQRYTAGLLLPATIEDSIYALPETMNFYVLYYRSDIIGKIGLEIPDTMTDVINMLPELQMRGLNFFMPIQGMPTMRNFHGTMPILYQMGASLFGEAANETTLNSESAVEGFTFLTELFTIYNMDEEIPSFYQRFRSGEIPLGVADFGTYNQLKNAAPEIANSWSVAPVPGIMQEDGTVDRSVCGGMESTVMFETTPEREAMAWEFMKWWSSAEVQAEYGQTLQVSYGDEYMWPTANTEAFAQLPFDTEDKQVILEMAEWIKEPPRFPGSYMLEREMSNAFNDIVVNGDNLRTRLDTAVKNINRELERKLKEFGYSTEEGDGKVVYIVPTLDIIKEIIGEE